MDNKKVKQPEVFEMVLYACPWCGMMNFRDIKAIINHDFWPCPFCKAIHKAG